MVPTLWQRVLFCIYGTNIIELLLALLLNMAEILKVRAIVIFHGKLSSDLTNIMTTCNSLIDIMLSRTHEMCSWQHYVYQWVAQMSINELCLSMSCTEYSLFNRALLQGTPVIWRSLLIAAAPYQHDWVASRLTAQHGHVDQKRFLAQYQFNADSNSWYQHYDNVSCSIFMVPTLLSCFLPYCSIWPWWAEILKVRAIVICLNRGGKIKVPTGVAKQIWICTQSLWIMTNEL